MFKKLVSFFYIYILLKKCLSEYIIFWQINAVCGGGGVCYNFMLISGVVCEKFMSF